MMVHLTFSVSPPVMLYSLEIVGAAALVFDVGADFVLGAQGFGVADESIGFELVVLAFLHFLRAFVFVEIVGVVVDFVGVVFATVLL